MQSRKISQKAKWLHKSLIVGAVSLTLLGTLSGCADSNSSSSANKPKTHREVSRIVNHKDLSGVLTNRKIQSETLTGLMVDQFEMSDEGPMTDITLHNGYVELSDGYGTTTHSFNNYSPYYHTDHRIQKIRYHINNQKKTITFTSQHINNSLASITYKFSTRRRQYLAGKLCFKPIRLRRFGYKNSVKIPKHVAEHNWLYLNPGVNMTYPRSHALSSVQHPKAKVRRVHTMNGGFVTLSRKEVL